MNQESLLEAPKQAVVLNTQHAREMMRKRFALPEWAFMEEVAPATGGGTRYADAVAVNLWSSRGHAIHGFEIKVSRGDWLKELKQPEKAEDIFKYCDHWSIVAPRGIVKDGELPLTWGYFELRESNIVQIKAPPKLESIPVTREFFASIMRRGHEQITKIAERMQCAAVMKFKGEIDERVRRDVEERTKVAHKLQAKIDEFEKATGLSFGSYEGPPIEDIKLAQRLNQLRTWREDGAISRLLELSAELDRAAKTVRDAVQEFSLHDVQKDKQASA